MSRVSLKRHFDSVYSPDSVPTFTPPKIPHLSSPSPIPPEQQQVTSELQHENMQQQQQQQSQQLTNISSSSTSPSFSSPARQKRPRSSQARDVSGMDVDYDEEHYDGESGARRRAVGFQPHNSPFRPLPKPDIGQSFLLF